MSFFLYARQNVGGRLRIGAAAIARLRFHVPPLLAELLLAFLVLVALVAMMDAVRADERRSPCKVFGQSVSCDHFISSSPAQNKIRDEDLATRIQRDQRQQQDRKNDQK